MASGRTGTNGMVSWYVGTAVGGIARCDGPPIATTGSVARRTGRVRAGDEFRKAAVAVGLDAEMSTLYEEWSPSVGDRVRVVMRDETGDAEDEGRTGTIVAIIQQTPYVVCTVEYDARAGASGPEGAREHVESELEPIEATAARLGVGGREPTGGTGSAWQPTVGDRVFVASTGRGATVTAIDERGEDTVCEVEYDHVPGETAEPRRGSHSVRDLTPTKEPSAEALAEDSRR